jgi:hypothetical protein
MGAPCLRLARAPSDPSQTLPTPSNPRLFAAPELLKISCAASAFIKFDHLRGRALTVDIRDGKDVRHLKLKKKKSVALARK